jgi:lantibiotic modifying enzyme
MASHLARRAIVDGDTMCWTSAGAPANLPLLGLSHGASGPGLAFAELFAATGERRWRSAARACFAFERQWFCSGENNWPDLRYLQSAPDGHAPPYLIMWCHGAAGIGLARAHAAALLDNDQLRSEAAIALDTTQRWVLTKPRVHGVDLSLCHGLAGSADILLTCSELVDEPGFAHTALRAADVLAKAVLASDLSSPDRGGAAMMTGWPGIGLFLLRTLHRTRFDPLHACWRRERGPDSTMPPRE